MKKIVELLKAKNKTIATMESCSGGAIANEITCIEGASDVLKFSAVTYSNEYKIKMGVSSKVIDKYSVYSEETACEMSKNISEFANSNYGIGITGKINKEDKNNLFSDNSKIYISIYNKDENKYFNFTLNALKDKNRKENKNYIIDEIVKKLNTILNNERSEINGI